MAASRYGNFPNDSFCIAPLERRTRDNAVIVARGTAPPRPVIQADPNGREVWYIRFRNRNGFSRFHIFGVGSGTLELRW